MQTILVFGGAEGVPEMMFSRFTCDEKRENELQVDLLFLSGTTQDIRCCAPKATQICAHRHFPG